MQRDDLRHRRAQQRAVDPRRVEEVDAARPVGLDDLVGGAGGRAQRGEQAARVAADAARVARGPRVERDPHRARRSSSALDAVGEGLGAENRRGARASPRRPSPRGGRARATTAAASSRGRFGATSAPVTPSSTTSGSPPTRVATTGVPAASASAATVPNGSSTRLGTTRTSRCAHQAAASSTQPKCSTSRRRPHRLARTRVGAEGVVADEDDRASGPRARGWPARRGRGRAAPCAARAARRTRRPAGPSRHGGATSGGSSSTGTPTTSARERPPAGRPTRRRVGEHDVRARASGAGTRSTRSWTKSDGPRRAAHGRQQPRRRRRR